MRIIDSQTTQAALPFERLIPAIRSLFVSGCEVPQRHSYNVTAADGARMTVLVMPAWTKDRYLGIKTVNVAPENVKSGLPGLFSTYVLYDARRGAPLAQIDGDQITSRRTAAASALAASHLARRDSECLVVVGAGRVGSLIAEAFREVLPIDRVMVWDKHPEKAHALVARLTELGFDAIVALDLATAVGDADVVSCTTLATEPVIHGDWLKSGSHLDLIGSFTPLMREADDQCFCGAGIYIDTEEALQKSGDLTGPMSRGIFKPQDIRGTLAALCRREVEGRHWSGERTVFKSVGTALEDLAAALLVFESAVESA